MIFFNFLESISLYQMGLVVSIQQGVQSNICQTFINILCPDGFQILHVLMKFVLLLADDANEGFMIFVFGHMSMSMNKSLEVESLLILEKGKWRVCKGLCRCMLIGGDFHL